MSHVFELVYAPGQEERGMPSSAVEEYLQRESFIQRALAADDALVLAWINGDVPYPEGLKKKGAVLWSSIDTERGVRTVKFLYWSGDRVHIAGIVLGGLLNGSSPALLKPASDS